MTSVGLQPLESTDVGPREEPSLIQAVRTQRSIALTFLRSDPRCPDHGRRQEAERFRAEAERIADEWNCGFTDIPPLVRQGLRRSAPANWTRAEEHHRAAITRMEAVPYVTAQPIARYWYADMLAERGSPGDVEAAKAKLKESIAASDKIGLALYARLARQRLARIA